MASMQEFSVFQVSGEPYDIGYRLGEIASPRPARCNRQPCSTYCTIAGRRACRSIATIVTIPTTKTPSPPRCSKSATLVCR
ncbi:hypothetical protein OKW45_001523 [Paraburkholderia sp. WSM4175]|uniref:hypothetical protein n=1 Tax=Paraburkholderia sp. WSM4175 TaxID=2991072 RepID=UPI003D20B27C